MIRITLVRDAERRLVFTAPDGKVHLEVEPVRAFPLSDPAHAVSILDALGREIYYIDSLEDVEPEGRRALEQELARREFVPVILRVVNTPPRTEPATWKVETDRGITTFEIESEDSVHRRDPFRISIVDRAGIRYEIPDTRTLDAHSRNVLDRFL
jgi:hypothetical protein